MHKYKFNLYGTYVKLIDKINGMLIQNWSDFTLLSIYIVVYIRLDKILKQFA